MFRKNIYVKNNLSPFKISRTKIDLFFDIIATLKIKRRILLQNKNKIELKKKYLISK